MIMTTTSPHQPKTNHVEAAILPSLRPWSSCSLGMVGDYAVPWCFRINRSHQGPFPGAFCHLGMVIMVSVSKTKEIRSWMLCAIGGIFLSLHSSTVPQSLTYQTVSTGPRQLRRQKFEPNLISYNTVTWFYHCMGNSGRKLCMKLQEVPSNHRSSTDISWNSVDIRVSMGDRISIHWGGRCICTSRGSRQRGGSLGTSLARCFGG